MNHLESIIKLEPKELAKLDWDIYFEDSPGVWKLAKGYDQRVMAYERIKKKYYVHKGY